MSPIPSYGQPTDPSQPPVGSLTNRYSAYRKPLEEPPLLFEPLKAYRHWMRRGGTLLTPIHGSLVWESGENRAFCGVIGDDADKCLQPKCSCGFYSVWTPGNDYAKVTDALYVGGVVELYGKVVIGSIGARASRARIVALHLPNPDQWSPFRRNASLMRKYPDVRYYRRFKNMCTKEGVKRPDNLVYAEGTFG